MSRTAANRRRDDFGPLSDLEDLRGATPELDADFHHPCPGCGQELVIRADQAIRRVKCGTCNQVYGLDQRIGGELCLLPHHAKEHADHRSFLTRFAAFRLRVFTVTLALFVLVGISVMLMYESLVVLAGLTALAVFFGQGIARNEARRKAPGSRRKTRRKTRRRRPSKP